MSLGSRLRISPPLLEEKLNFPMPNLKSTLAWSPDIGTASWSHVDPHNIRSGSEYPAEQGGMVITRLSLGCVHDW